MLHTFFKTGMLISSPALMIVYWWKNLRNPNMGDNNIHQDAAWLEEL